MAKERIFDLPETKGSFQLSGIVTGTKKDGFLKELKTKNHKDMAIVNFGVSYEEGKTLYLNIQGMEQDNVYFSKKAEKKGEKAETEKVPWVNRFNYNREGFRMIGKNIGVQKIINDKGEEVNDKKILTDYDAAKEVSEHLVDDKSVFTRGNFEYSHYTDDNGNVRRNVKLIPQQVSLCKPIDFADDDFVPTADFNQTIVFMGIEQEKENDKATGRFIVSAKIVNYSSIEDAEFIVEDSKLATLFKKNLKPYTAIKVSGKMTCNTQTEQVVDEDSWGEEDAMKKATAPTKREFVITGAKPSTIDKELYTEDKINAAYAAIAKKEKAENDFGDVKTSDDWGTAMAEADDDDTWDD